MRGKNQSNIETWKCRPFMAAQAGGDHGAVIGAPGAPIAELLLAGRSQARQILRDAGSSSENQRLKNNICASISVWLWRENVFQVSWKGAHWSFFPVTLCRLAKPPSCQGPGYEPLLFPSVPSPPQSWASSTAWRTWHVENTISNHLVPTDIH